MGHSGWSVSCQASRWKRATWTGFLPPHSLGELAEIFCVSGFILFSSQSLLWPSLFILWRKCTGRRAIRIALAAISDRFFFSVQTLATIGYGRITPVGLLPNLIVTMEAFVGMLMVALGTGLVFARVSRPTARVAFSDQALVTTIDGDPCLGIRAANERANQLVDARVAITLTRAEQSEEGIWYRNIYDLKLERSWNSVFALSWTIVHPIDAQSPFKDLTPEKMKEDEVMLVVSISGTDDTMAQTVHARTVYLWDEIVFGGQFVDMTEYSDEDGLRINLGAISKLEQKRI